MRARVRARACVCVCVGGGGTSRAGRGPMHKSEVSLNGTKHEAQMAASLQKQPNTRNDRFIKL